MRVKLLVAGFALAFAVQAGAAPAPAHGYDPRETFAPRDMGQAVNGYRSANGLPGREWVFTMMRTVNKIFPSAA